MVGDAVIILHLSVVLLPIIWVKLGDLVRLGFIVDLESVRSGVAVHIPDLLLLRCLAFLLVSDDEHVHCPNGNQGITPHDLSRLGVLAHDLILRFAETQDHIAHSELGYVKLSYQHKRKPILGISELLVRHWFGEGEKP